MVRKFGHWPNYDKEDITAVKKVLCSGKVNQWTGCEVFKFEREYADYLGVKYAVALTNGSVALDMALMALDIGPGDEVIVPCRSFVASASCVALRGARPVFCDIDRESQNITAEEIEKVFTKKTKAIIAVHLAGWPCALDKLRNFCNKKGVFLIEDCAQAHGARYKGKPVGSFGDVSCFSFCQDKIISTGGEGGLLATNSKKIWQKVWSFKDHGRDYEIMFNKKRDNSFVWAVSSFGSNYRMTEMQAAIGRMALGKLDKWVNKRRELASILTEGFKELPQLRVTVPSDREYHSYYKYYVFVNKDRLGKGLNRDKIISMLRKQGIPCGTGICPEIYLEKAFRDYKKILKSSRLPIARELGETSIMFQVHPTLKKSNMHQIVEAMGKILG
jgi:dTDP-4-amino-4,6-dideoxygalactose transaminase